MRRITVKSLGGDFLSLMLSLVAFIVVYPFLSHGARTTSLILAAFASVVVIAIVHAFYEEDRKHFFNALFLGAALILFNFVSVYSSSEIYLYIQIILSIIFYLYAIVLLARYIITTNEITSDIIYGTVSVYILMGILWASIYGLIVMISPNSFSSLNENLDLFYYSFVTLTSLGFGDIVPISPYAQSASILEAVVGVLYLAIVVARIVGVYVSDAVMAKRIAREIKKKNPKPKSEKR